MLELSSYVLESPNDADTTLDQNLIGCSTLSQEYTASLMGNLSKWLRRQLWTLTCPIVNWCINKWPIWGVACAKPAWVAAVRHFYFTFFTTAQVYQTVLTIYECDSRYDFPTRNEVLLCNEKTTVEEVCQAMKFIGQHILNNKQKW